MPPPIAPRQYPSKVVRQFRGISQYRSLVNVPMDHALNLLNVFISMSGALEKFRLPVALTTQANFPLAGAQSVIDTFFDYQKSDGTRQIVFNAGPCIGYYVANVSVLGVEIIPYVFNVIEDNVPADNSRWSWCESNNILYGANGQVMRKWTGSKWQQMGIGTFGTNPPAPVTGISFSLNSIQRAGGTVTFNFNAATPDGAVNKPSACFTTDVMVGGIANGRHLYSGRSKRRTIPERWCGHLLLPASHRPVKVYGAVHSTSSRGGKVTAYWTFSPSFCGRNYCCIWSGWRQRLDERHLCHY